MTARADLTLFAHIAGRAEADLNLAQAALLVAETEYPRLDVGHYLGVLDRMGAEAKKSLEREVAGGEVERVRRVVRWLYDDLGFRGNQSDYYDPRNSFLNDVLDRRTGIPITLAIVLMEIVRRTGGVADGISFPGHFLVRTKSAAGPVFIDPFEGRILARADLRAMHARATGQDRDPDPRLLEAATKKQILVRMLNNLRGIYTTRGDRERLRAILERMGVLVKSEALNRELAQLGGQVSWPSSGGSAIN